MSQTSTTNFPSHFVSPAEKEKPEWILAYQKAFHGEVQMRPTETCLARNKTSYETNRKYARGEQSDNQYKERLVLPSDHGKPNTSFRNLNWDIFKIAPSLRNTLVSKIVDHEYRLNVKAIDSISMSKRRYERAKILEYITQKEAIEAYEKYAQTLLARPGNPEELDSLTAQMVDVYLDMSPKDQASMEIKDYLTYVFALNDWPQLATEIMGDEVDNGVGAIEVCMDEVNAIRYNRWFPEKTVTNKCITNDFRDMIRVGYYDEITVSDFKKMTNGSLGEAKYKELADKHAGTGRYTGDHNSYYLSDSFCYAYDVEKIKIFKSYWFSDDKYVHEQYTTKSGNKRLEEKNYNYVPFRGDKTVNEGKGMSDDQYEQFHGGSRTILRTEIRNVYHGTWVVDTDVVVNYGRMTNMVRQASSVNDTVLPVVVYTTDFVSTIDTIISLLDQFQLNWLQFQSHIAASRPPGIAIEKNALAKAAMTPGQAGAQINWKEILQQFAETGNIVFDGYNIDGQPLPWLPFKDLPNGLSEGAFRHLDIMMQMLQFIRSILGVSELAAGQNPPERLGKAVAQLSLSGTETAISYLNRAYRNIYERVAKITIGLLPMAIENGQLPGMSEALGLESMRFFDMNKDLGLREMGITIEEGPDDLIRQRISDAINIAIQKDQLDAEDAVMIEWEDNPYRAIQMLKSRRKIKSAERMKEQMALQDQQAQNDQQTAALKEQLAQKTLAMQMQTDERRFAMESAMKDKGDQESFLREVILTKLKAGLKIEEDEQKFINNIVVTKLVGEMANQRVMIAGDKAIEKQEVANEKPVATSTK